jgi:hypothetical protein
MQSLISVLIGRALEILGRVEFSPQAVRADLSLEKVFPGYLYSASELIDRAANPTSESATLVHVDAAHQALPAPSLEPEATAILASSYLRGVPASLR